MKFASTIFAAAMGALLASQPALAQKLDPVLSDLVSDKPDVVLDPAKTYLLIESDVPTVATFYRMPSPEEEASWEAQRAEKYAKAVKEYPRKHLQYRQRMARIERVGGRDIPAEPVDPAESFNWPDVEQSRTFSIGDLNRSAKDGPRSLYLNEVEPGEYVFYGVGLLGLHDCMCMGTVRFTVDPGSVTVLRLGQKPTDGMGKLITAHPDRINSTDMLTRFAFELLEPTPFAYDSRIPRERIAVADYRAVDSLANWFGGRIARVSPIEGVIAYDRGRMVDLRAAPEGNASISNEAPRVTDAAAPSDGTAAE